MKIKKIISLCLSVLLLIFVAACSSSNGGSTENTSNTLDKIKEKGKLVIAMNPEFAPFEFKTLIDGKNTVVGSDVELAKAIADELGVELEISEMSFDNVLGSLQAGKADLAISGISKTAEREKVYDFSESYYTAKNVVIVAKEDLASYKTTDSLSGKSVATQKGSVQEQVAKEQLSGINQVSLTANGAMINELLAGKVQGVVLEEPIAKGYVANNPSLAIAEIALDSSETDAYAIAMNKGQDELKEVVNKVVKDLVDSGKYEAYVEEAYELSVAGTEE